MFGLVVKNAINEILFVINEILFQLMRYCCGKYMYFSNEVLLKIYEMLFQAAELVTENEAKYEAHMRKVRDYLETQLTVS